MVKASCAVVSEDRKLVVLPLVSLAAVLSTSAVLLFSIWQTDPFVTVVGPYGESTSKFTPTPAAAAIFVVGTFVVTFIGMSFNAALIVAANERLDGGDPTVRSALAGAMKHAGPIAIWALISCTISIALRAASERAGLLGRIVLSITGVVWSVATFFVLPAMIVEGIGVKAAFRRSKSLLRSTWGEQVIGGGMVSVLIIPALVILAIVALILAQLSWIVGLGSFVVGTLLVIAFGNMVSMVFSTVLYKFAQNGVAPAGFTAEQLNSAFDRKKPKKKKRFGF